MTATPSLPAVSPSAASRRATYLVVPQLAQLAPLARAWFPEAEWVVEPSRTSSRPAAVGARFRGLTSEATSQPGQLRLTWAAHLEGPVEAGELEAAGLDPVAKGVVLRLCVAPGSPADPRLLAWLRAAARRSGGSVLHGAVPGVPSPRSAPGVSGFGAAPAEAASVERAEPESAVELAVYSAVPVAPEVTLGLVRAVVPSATILSAPGPDEGIAPYVLALPTQFDGTVELRFSRAGELPVCLLELDWRDYGPFAYRASWQPPREMSGSTDDSLSRVARARVRPLVARVIFSIQRAAGGAVVDEDGFVLSHDELVARAVSM